MFTSAIAALAVLAALPTNAFFILSHKSLVTTRLDPIVSPGAVSGHVHSIVGGSNFDKTMSFESARRSKCTTAPVSVDLSNYWVPQLYYYNPTDKTYQLITVAFVNTYYLPRGNGKIHAFPDGLRMVSGNPFRRSYSGSVEDQAISFVCLDYYNDHRGDPAWDQRNNFFSHNCPQGMRAQVNFPSCWDGVNLDSADHKSHMAFASGGPEGGGDCPASHPVHLVTLFYEFIYETQNFPYNAGSDPTWVFANGDTTGFGFHGDFVNGWPSLVNGTNILQEAIDGCNANNGVGGNLKDCPPFVSVLDNDAANGCKPENQQVNEDIGYGHPIPLLPGNNPIWMGNGTKPSSPGYVEPNTTFTDFTSVIPAGYDLVGCMAESTDGRSLRGASFSNNNMTRGACVSWCQGQGFPLAGTQFGRECYCDFQIRGTATNTTLLNNDKCNVNCANNVNEACGGSNTLTLFNNKGMYPTTSLPQGWSENGCMTEASGGRALKEYSFASGSMTPELCMSGCQAKGYKYAGAEYSSECYCGNSFGTGSTAASSSECSMTCSGNNKRFCGGPNRLTTWSFANSTIAPTSTPANSTIAIAIITPPAYVGCFADGSPRTLNGTSYTDGAMTSEICVSYCATRGFAFAGMETTQVEQGSMPQECRCGNILNQSLAVSASRCSAKCTGNAGETCGGDLALSVWTTANGTAVRTGSAPTKRGGPVRLSY